VKHLYCSFFGHDYQISKKVTYHVKEYTCKYCKEQVTTNENGKLTLLTPKYKEINAVLERIHYKRLKRKHLILDR
jgi:nucleoid-associated protein YejK